MAGPRLFTMGLVAIAALMLASGLPLAPPARRVPIMLLCPTLVALLVQLWLDWRGPGDEPGRGAPSTGRPKPPGQGDNGAATLAPWRAITAILGAAFATDLMGVELSVPAVLLLWLKYQSRCALWQAALAGLFAWLVLRFGLQESLGVFLPPGRLILAVSG